MVGCRLTDALRMAVADALCRSAERRGHFKEAMFELETEDTLGGCALRPTVPAAMTAAAGEWTSPYCIKSGWIRSPADLLSACGCPLQLLPAVAAADILGRVRDSTKHAHCLVNRYGAVHGGVPWNVMHTEMLHTACRMCVRTASQERRDAGAQQDAEGAHHSVQLGDGAGRPGRRLYSTRQVHCASDAPLNPGVALPYPIARSFSA